MPSSLRASEAPSSRPPRSLTLSKVFLAIARRGRWAHGPSLSVGGLPNALGVTRIGLRTPRGMKGAVVRNRLKRRLRPVIFQRETAALPTMDVVVVVKARAGQQNLAGLRREFEALRNQCRPSA